MNNTDSELPKYVLFDRINQKVWHEQYDSFEEANEKIQAEKFRGKIGNWVIEAVYSKIRF